MSYLCESSFQPKNIKLVGERSNPSLGLVHNLIELTLGVVELFRGELKKNSSNFELSHLQFDAEARRRSVF